MAQLTSLAGTHLSVEDAASYLGEMRPSARLRRAVAGETPTAVLGGDPELPSSMEWPSWEATPLDFLAAIDLHAVHTALPDAPLPLRGRLLFFAIGNLFGPANELYGPSNQLVGAIQPVSRPGWRVIYLAEGVETAPRSMPDGTHQQSYQFRRVDCVLEGEPTVPHWGAFDRLRSIDVDRAQEFEEALWEADRGPFHRIGGWPDPTQSEPAVTVALADAGHVGDDGFVHYRHPDMQRLYDTANEDWFLLLQLDTDDGPDGPGWMWGDAGVMFFYVRPQAAAVGDFDSAWMNWDCH
jgi:uncharacterized protein YwqG